MNIEIKFYFTLKEKKHTHVKQPELNCLILKVLNGNFFTFALFLRFNNIKQNVYAITTVHQFPV